jgi:hypothetical protein
MHFDTIPMKQADFNSGVACSIIVFYYRLQGVTADWTWDNARIWILE